jgi:hypothetical protein
MADYKKVVSLFRKKRKGFSNQSFGSQETECDLGTSYNPFLHKEVKNDTSFGIDWATFKLYADELGYSPTCENFKSMPIGIYNVIFKKRFWDSIGGDKIKNQGIANILVQNQGLGIAFIFDTLKKFGYIRPYQQNTDLKSSIDNSFKLIDEDIDFINKLDSEGKSPLLFDELTVNDDKKSRIYWISKLYNLRASEKITIGVGILLVGYLSYKLIKR